MGSIVDRLTKLELINPPGHVRGQVQLEVMMGSVAYGVEGESSDVDVYGFCIPAKDDIFPHLRGEIVGFGRQKQRFEQFQQHHVEDASSGKQYDLAIYNIVKYFSLCMENNPNMIDSLFVPQFCILHMTEVGQMVREARKLFLHKGSWHKFKGYAFSQLHKMAIKTPQEGSKRAASVEKHGYDCKFAYHVVRLLDEVEQILTLGDIDLLRNREQLKAIRRGEVSEESIRELFTRKEKDLEELYHSSSLRYSPDQKAIRDLLLACLEHHYGSLSSVLGAEETALRALREVQDVIDRHRALLA